MRQTSCTYSFPIRRYSIFSVRDCSIHNSRQVGRKHAAVHQEARRKQHTRDDVQEVAPICSDVTANKILPQTGERPAIVQLNCCRTEDLQAPERL